MWVAFAALIAGITITFYRPRRRVWTRIAPDGRLGDRLALGPVRRRRTRVRAAARPARGGSAAEAAVGVASIARRLLPAERPNGEPHGHDRPDRQDRQRPDEVVPGARPERDPERIRQRRGRQPRRDGRQRLGQVRDGDDDPAEQQERDEQAVRERERGLRPKRTREQQPETRERGGPEQQGDARRPRPTLPVRRSSRGRRWRSRPAARPGRSRRRRTVPILAASRPPRVSGEPPRRLRTP